MLGVLFVCPHLPLPPPRKPKIRVLTILMLEGNGMAFDAGTANDRKQGNVVVEVEMEVDGERKTHSYLLRQITRGEMVRLMAESRKKGQGAIDIDLIGRVFENGDEVNGGMNLYDLIDKMDEDHQESFMSHVSELAVASRSRLSAMGVEVR